MITTVSDKEIAQAATIEQLRQEITAWSITAENLEHELEQKQRDANFWKLTAEVMESVRDALAADAARYQWLLSNAYVGIAPFPKPHEVWCTKLPNPAGCNCLDAAIDAAMKDQS